MKKTFILTFFMMLCSITFGRNNPWEGGINPNDFNSSNSVRVVEADDVAKIGDEGYSTLAAALADAQAGSTITFVADITEDVTINKAVTIDGAGKTYTGAMTLKANFTVKNVNFDGKGYNGYAITTSGANYVTIEDCTAKNYGYGFVQLASGTVLTTVKNVTVSNMNYGVKVDYSNAVVLENVDITAAVAAVLNSNYGEKTITIKNSYLKILGTWRRNDTNKTTYVFEGANTIDSFITDAAIDNFKLAEGATLTAPNEVTVTTDVEGYSVNYADGKYSVAENIADIAAIGEETYPSLTDALAAATAGDEVKILKEGTYELSTSGKNLTITAVVPGVEFENIGAKNMGGANVAFNNVTFKYASNSTYKGLQHSGNLVYNECTFDGQVFLYGQSETFNKCTFNQTTNNYNVWTYGAKVVAFNECTFNCAGKSVLIYSENASVTNNVSVTKCKFLASQAVEGKAAIEMDSSLQGAITLTIDGETTAEGFGTGNVSGNSLWNNKKGNDTEANNDITVTVDGNVVLKPIYSVSTKAELNAAISSAQDGDIVKMTADIDYSTDQLAIAKAIILDLGGKTLTTRNAYGGMSIKNNPIIKNGTIVHASNTAAIKVWNATAFEDLVIDVQGKGDANKTIGGIVLQSGSTTRVGSIKNVTIKGAALTNGIETYNCGDATENVIGSMENVTINAQGTGMLISAPCGTATNCLISGGTNGIEIWIKGNYSASLGLVDCDVVGGVYAHDEFNSNPSIVNNGELSLVADDATTGVDAEDITLVIARAENVKGVLKDYMDNAEAKIGDTYYATLADAIATVGSGDVVIELVNNATLSYGAREAYGVSETTSLTIKGNGKVLTLNQTNSDWSSFGLANAEAKVVFKNMIIEKTGYGDTSGAWNTHAIIFSCPLEMTDVTVNNGIAVQAGAALDNVTINEAGEYYGLWINGNGQTVTMNGGSITATNAGRGIKIADQYIDNPAQVTLNVTGTDFNTAKKAAVLVSSTAGAKITANNVNIEDVVADKVNFVWVDEDWAANFSNVEVIGATVVQEGIEGFVAAVSSNDIIIAYYQTLSAAIDACGAGTNTITLLADCDEDVTIKQEEGVNVIIDGAGFAYSGTFTIHGNSRYEGEETLTFKNINFVTDKAGHYFIDSNSTASAERYAHNVTVNNCNFKATGAGVNSAAAMRIRQGYDIAIIGGTFTGLHSALQAYGNTGITVDGVTIEGGKNGIAVGTSTDVVIKKSNITATGYGVRADGEGAYDMTLAGNTITANLPVVVRKATGAYELTVGEGNNFTASNEKGAAVVFTTGDDGTFVAPTSDATATITGDVTTFGFEARIENVHYTTFANALAAAEDGDTVTVLEDMEEAVAITNLGKNVTFDGNGNKMTAGIVIGTDNNKLDSDEVTIKNFKFENKGVSVKELLNVTIEANTFENITGDAILVVSDELTSMITVKDNEINTVAGAGINLRCPISATIEGNTVKNTTGNSITLQKNGKLTDHEGAISIANNVMENWASGKTEGRAIRMALGSAAKTVVVENNAMIKTDAPEEFVKITGYNNNTTVSIDKNYWNGTSPVEHTTPSIYLADGVYPSNYYASYDATNGLSNLVEISYVAKIGTIYYNTFASALAAVQNGETIELLDIEGNENTEIEFEKAIGFTVTGSAPKYALPVVTFQNATVNIKDATILIPELDARQNATINVINSTVYGAGGDGIVKSYYNGAISIDKTSTVYTMQVTTMGYITVAGTLNATWQTNVYGNGLITLNEGAKFNTAALQLTGKEYSGRDNTDAERVGKPAEIIVNGGANFVVGSVKSSSGADYSYNSSYGVNIGTIAGKSAVLTLNGGNVDIYMADGQNVNIGTLGTVEVGASTMKTICRKEGGTVGIINNGTINFSELSAELHTATADLDVTTTVAGYSVKYVEGVYKHVANLVLNTNTGDTYATLAEAIDAAVTGNEIVLLSDIELSDEDIVVSAPLKTMVYVEGKDITLDMNGKAISVKYEGEPHLIGVVCVADAAGLTVKGNGSIEVKGVAYDDQFNVAYVFCKRGTTGHLTIEDGTYHAADLEDSMVYTNGDDIVTIKGGTFTLDNVGTQANGFPCIFNTQHQNANSIVVNGGTFNTDVNHQFWTNEVYVPETLALQNNGDGTWTVVESVAYVNEIGTSTGSKERKVGYASLADAVKSTGATVTVIKAHETKAPAIVEKDFTIDMNGMAVTAAENVYPVIRVQNGANVTVIGEGSIENAADYVFVLGSSDKETSGNLTIENGTFTGMTTVASVTKGLLTINGGEFKVKDGEYGSTYLINCYDANYKDGSAKVAISGGTFYGFNPENNAAEGEGTNFCATGYGAVETGSDIWTVVPRQSQQLSAGWNWFSSYMSEFDGKDGLTMIQNQLGENGIEVKNHHDGTSRYEAGYGWYGNLKSVNVRSMYMINVAEENPIEIGGAPVTSCTITLKPGWNAIGFPSIESINVADVFAQVQNNDKDYIKSKDQYVGYDGGYWEDGSLQSMEPGKGYMYYNAGTTDQVLEFPIAKSRGEVRANMTTENNYWVANGASFANNMTMTAVLNVNGVEMTDNYEVAAFAGDEVRGSARPVYVESIDRYVMFMTIYGEGNEELTFKYIDLDTYEVHNLNDMVVYADNAMLGSLRKPVELCYGTMGIGENGFDTMSLYPNPTRTGRTISLEAICDMVEVFNSLGVKVAEYRNVETIDGIEEAGVYVIRVTNGETVKNCRLIVR